MCMCVRAAMAEGWRLQRLPFASFSALEKMHHAPFRLPPLPPLPFHAGAGTCLTGVPLAVVLKVREGSYCVLWGFVSQLIRES